MHTHYRSLLIAAASLTGCTSLSVSEVVVRSDGGPRPTTLPPGLVYQLPAAVLTPTAYVTIRDCVIDEKVAAGLKSGPPAGIKPLAEVKFVVGGAIPVQQVQDQMIRIDPRRLQAFLKTTGISTERWPNGMLKTVNASIEDQTPQALAALAAAAGSVASLTTGAPIAGALAATTASKGATRSPARSPDADVTFVACREETLDLLAERRKAVTARKAAVDLLADATAAAKALARRNDVEPEELDALQADMAKHSAAVDVATAEIAQIDGQLTLPLDMVDTLEAGVGGNPTVMPADGRLSPSRLAKGVRFTPSKLDEFMRLHFVAGSAKLRPEQVASFNDRACTKVADQTCRSIDSVRAALRKIASVELRDVTLRADPTDRDNRPLFPALRQRKSDLLPVTKGIVYVEPARMTLSMTAPRLGARSLMSPRQVVKTAEVTIPQLGQYLLLPLRAGFGEKVELKATFAEDGSLLTASFANPRSMGLSIAEASRDLAAGAVGARDAAEQRKQQILQNRAEALAKAVAIRDSQGKLTPKADPLDDLNAELAKASAEAALAEAQVRIQAAKAKLGSP